MESNIIYALIVALAAGPAAGYLGSIMVSKHMALVGDALSHVALPGLAIGLIFNFNPFIGAFAFVASAMMLTWYVEKVTVLAVEAIVGVLFVLALAIGVLITPEPDLLEALFGDVSKVTWVDAVITVAVSSAVIVITRAIYSRMALTMISKEMAVSEGINVSRINLIFLLLVALVVSVGIKEVGTLLVGAVVIVPAAGARNVSGTLRSYAALSTAIGAISAATGVISSQFLSIPAGPLVVITGTVIFALLLVLYKVFSRAGREATS